MDKRLKIAVLFRKLFEDEKVEAFTPHRILLGKTDEEELKFFDILSNTVYYSLDNYNDDANYSGFYYPKTFKEIHDMFPEYKTFDAIYQYFNSLKNNAYYYSLETGSAEDFCLKTSTMEEFEKKFKVRIKYYDTPDNLDTIDFPKLEQDIRQFQDALKNMEEYGLSEQNDYEDDFETEKEQNQYNALPNITEVYEEITKHIFCQDKQIKRVLSSIYRSFLNEHPKLKANIFLYGPTGVGKTAIIEYIGKKLGLPVTIEDSNDFTITGYEGSNCSDALRHLYEKANGDLELAQQGILVFDEIDKKRKKGGNNAGIASEGVQNTLLKIIEGGKIEITLNKLTGEKIMFDTSRLKVIVGGAFQDLYKKPKGVRAVGFQQVEKETTANDSNIMKKLVDYGMAEEFLGRFNAFVELSSLSKDDLKHILLDAESSVLKIYQAVFVQNGYNVAFTDELCDKISELAYKLGFGARGLNMIVNEIFDEIMYDFYSKEHINNEIILDTKVLEKTGYGEQKILKKSVQ